MSAPKKIYLSKLVMAGAEILDKPVSDDDVEYIRADVIRTEIKRLKSLLVRGACAAQIEMETNCKEEAYDEVLSFLSTLESEKPVPSDLQEYASRAGFDYVDNIVQEYPGHRFNDHDVEYAYRDGIIAGANWQKQHDAELIEIAYNDGITIGMTKQKEQMMKGTVEYEVWDFSSSLEACPHVTIPLDNKQYRNGDKVRVIIVKEDEK